MSRPQPTRPGAPARRPSGPPSKGGTSSGRGGQSIEELNALPEFIEEGDNISLDPADASDGGLGAGEGTDVTIVGARFGKFQYNGRDDIAPELRLFLNFQREGFDSPREESLKYADFGKFAPTKDGNFVKARASAIRENKDGSKYTPSPYKYAAGVLFLQSLKDAGLSADKLNKEGLASLTGLAVHVRKRKVAGQGENAKPTFMVDYIDGFSPAAAVSTAPAAATTAPAATAPKRATTKAKETPAPAPVVAETPAVDDGIAALAEQALLDMLQAAPENTISRSQIPTTILRMEQWKSHEHRGVILKMLRDDAFINAEGQPWVVNGTSVVLG